MAGGGAESTGPAFTPERLGSCCVLQRVAGPDINSLTVVEKKNGWLDGCMDGRMEGWIGLIFFVLWRKVTENFGYFLGGL